MGYAANTTPDIGRVVIDGIGYAVSTAQVTATASGNTQIIAAPGAGNQIKIVSVIELMSDTELTVQVQDANANLLAGPYYPAARGGISRPELVENDNLADANVAVNVNLSATGNVNVRVGYVTV